MRYFEHVVVGLAMAPVDRDLLRYARMVHEMGQGQTRCTFIHVLPSADADAPRGALAPSLTDARALLQNAIAEHFGDANGHEPIVAHGNRVDVVLCHLAELSADLVLVGHRRSSRGRRAFSRRLATKAPCSVWMVPEGSPARITGVLAAVDLSLPSAQAISLATCVARRAGLARCVALHVQPPGRFGFDDVERATAAHALERFLSPLELHDVEVTPVIEESGSVAGAVEAQAAAGGQNLIVVGTRGRNSSAAVLLGSESEHVLAESSVPVLITKEPGERIGILRALLDRDFHLRGPRFGQDSGVVVRQGLGETVRHHAALVAEAFAPDASASQFT